MAGGRPRSKQVDCAIVDAALSLLRRHGYQNLTMESIAERAHVGRPTLYRRWPSKASLVLDAYLCATYSTAPVPDTGSTRRDLKIYLRRLCRSLQGQEGQTLIKFIADAQSDAELLKLFRKRIVLPRRRLAVAILEHGIARGELRDDIDVELFCDMLHGPLWYRLLIGHRSLSPAFADQLAGELLRLVRKNSKTPGSQVT